MSNNLDQVLKGLDIQIGYASDILKDPQKMSTGLSSLDKIIGGGYPIGHLVEIFGPESAGKTFLSTLAMKSCQTMGKVAAFIDAENILSPHFIEKLNIDKEKLIYATPSSAEQAFDTLDRLIKVPEIGLIIIDSIPALVPEREKDSEAAEQAVGLLAKMLAKSIRKITAEMTAKDKVVLFINQIRERFGITFGNPETTIGGKALPYASALRLDLRKRGAIGDAKKPAGNVVKVKVVKNKFSPPNREVEFELFFDTGINKMQEFIQRAINLGVFQHSGSMYSYKDQKWRGRDKLYTLLQENKEFYNEVVQAVKDVESK